ncbi:hypothetical protein CICLE_v10027521mg [Citrus x clementina]|uniref:Ribosomal eL28/Mak16 domain-containing protein n=1 Tax=Citrus clementina TaxID=85681 RepID=V4UK37_CITCL|nr:hypothetical protein CICLE_v10027521mg [Citrus x clementina]
MATVGGQLIWEIVKKNNCFLVKEFGRGSASAHLLESLTKTVTIQPGKDQVVVLATTKTKKQNKPAALLHKSVMKHEIHRMAKVIASHVGDNYYQPDLKNAVEWFSSKP